MSSTKKQTKSALDHLKSHTIVVADTGDFESMREFKPTDATTNPSLILQAANIDKYQALIDQAVEYGATVEGDVNDKVNGGKTRPDTRQSSREQLGRSCNAKTAQNLKMRWTYRPTY